MFGFGKKKKEAKIKAEQEQLAIEEAQRKEESHKKLIEKYNKAKEYDERVAKGEDPETVRNSVYGQTQSSETKEEEVQVEEPVQEEPVEEKPVEEQPVEETQVQEEVQDEEPVEEETVEESAQEEVQEEPTQEEKPEVYDEVETEKKTLVKTVKKNENNEVVSVKEHKVEEEPKEEVQSKEDVKVEQVEESKEVKTPSKEEHVEETKPVKESKKVEEEANFKVLVEADPSDKTNGKYEIFQESGGFRYRLVASNGQVMATSEVYTSAKGAQNGITTLKNNLEKLIFRVETDKHRKSQFTASTQQNKLLVQSANYSSKSAAESAEESFKNFATATKIVLINDTDESEPELVDRTLFKNTTGKGKYEIVFNLNSQAYQFLLKASNGQTIITSKFYKSESSVKTAISKFRNDVKNGTFYTVKDKNGMYEFRLYNEANKLVQSGIAFDTKTKCISNIESVVRFIDSPIVNK
jgi:uncharacterized protein YegP (UPF0339 family)